MFDLTYTYIQAGVASLILDKVRQCMLAHCCMYGEADSARLLLLCMGRVHLANDELGNNKQYCLVINILDHFLRDPACPLIIRYTREP